jgi:hypothetical protein
VATACVWGGGIHKARQGGDGAMKGGDGAMKGGDGRDGLRGAKQAYQER